jgi:hypothetical protein
MCKEHTLWREIHAHSKNARGLKSQGHILPEKKNYPDISFLTTGATFVPSNSTARIIFACEIVPMPS